MACFCVRRRKLTTHATPENAAAVASATVIPWVMLPCRNANTTATAGDVIPLDELERRAIVHALAVAGGNVAKAAKLLGIGRATLYRRMSELHLQEKRA